jgi:hypothetical protein
MLIVTSMWQWLALGSVCISEHILTTGQHLEIT